MTLPFGIRRPASWHTWGSLLLVALWGWTTLPCLQVNPAFIFVHQSVPLPLVIASVVLVAAHWRSVPLIGWLWLLSGAVTVLWSLSPGFTLLSIQWDAVLLGALVAGQLLWKLPALPLSITAATSGWASLSLVALGARFYLSGSVMYIAAALAVPALSVYVALWWRQRRLLRLGSAVIAVVLLYIIGISASRAALLPTLLILGVATWRLHGEGANWKQLSLGLLLLLGGVALIDTLVFDHAVLQAIGLKTFDTLHKATQEGGNLETRLQMWEVAFHAFTTHPFGLGSGAYGDVFQSTQAWPAYYSRFVHNTFLETLASGGFLRFGALCWLLWQAFQNSWRSARWPVALALVGIWLNMCFDITGGIPSTLLIAFLTAGLSLGASETQHDKATQAPTKIRGIMPTLAALSALVVIGVTLAWWWPQDVEQQATWRGLWPPAIGSIPSKEREAVLTQAVNRFPKSIGLQKLWISSASESQREQRLNAVTQIIPYGDASFFLQLAQQQRKSGQSTQAAQTEALCLSHFGRLRSPLGLTLTPGSISGISLHDLCLHP
ncbi:O-antigen ligase family protein [Deinococcus sp. KNUC1210]|uniref:O-antigen ligase family protein n=1 Tax=Deinococcus sp. KNUC1210 TaxID=2917691 RepID=UPI001EEFF0AB|nr:O-antigen ligase family protein [Deinococcus sp. KNUC1210]ULH14414.1 O-antigen ligase family protein [Deinococcus sp. KNUC1210]